MKSVPEIADVVELQVWAEDQAYSDSALKEDLEAALPAEEMENAEEYARQVFEEVMQRARLLGTAYPFTCDGVTIAPNERKADSSYLFCLGLNFFEEITVNLRTREFEAVVKAAAESYFRGKAVRIGAPWRTGEITSYRELLEKVTDLIPDLGPPIQNEALGGGDAGWDVVVVNNFADGKFSRIIALGNCATGITDWRKKGMEAQPTLFWDFFTRPPQPYNICLTFIAVPFLMSEHEKKRKAGPWCIAFDRIRICEHAGSASPVGMEWLESQRNKALDLALV